MRFGIFLGLLLWLSSQSFSQNYFQQHVAYTIEVKLDDEANMLRGHEKLIYTNNSPDELNFIYFHLWPNAYKNNKTALAQQLLRLGKTEMYFARYDDLGYIDSLDFKVNGETCKLEFDQEHIDICKLRLNKPLQPGESIEVSTPFKVKIPSGSISRLGHIGQSFQITQWYPKPAVYDTAGWHPMPYLTQGEFYSEFGEFDVRITLPENYVVGATGDLQTTSEVEWLDTKVSETQKWLEERKELQDGKDVVADLAFPASSSNYKTLHYHQENVHDFGWFADKRYHVLKGKVALPQSGDSVTVWTMFTNKRAYLWQNSIEYMQDAVYYYSLWNGDYPYKQATAVDGTISAGGGMEYPNVTVIGDVGDALSLETVIMHEVGHNWFYGILGSNEREFPWLDEGVNSYNEQRYLSTKYPDGMILSKDGSNQLLSVVGLNEYGIEDQHELTYLLIARANRDQAMNLPSADYSFLNYGFVVYSKSAVTLNYLRHYLGDSTMDAGMHRYFEDNKFKHPYPKSLQNALELESGQNLDWFFNDIVTSRSKIDYGIKKVKLSENQTSIKLINRGLNVPVEVALLDGDSVVSREWIQGFEKDTSIVFDGVGGRVEIDHDQIMPELIRDNNYSKTKGLFKRTEPVSLRLLGSVEHPWKNKIYYFPILGLNVSNGAMPGLLLYNHSIPSRKFTYVLAPMYGLKSGSAVGTGVLSYSMHFENDFLETIELSVGGKRYGYDFLAGNTLAYGRMRSGLTMYFRPAHYSGFLSYKASFYIIQTSQQIGVIEPNGSFSKVFTGNEYYRGGAEILYDHPIYRTNVKLAFEDHSSFSRSSVELNERIKLTEDWKVSLRYFAGTFIKNGSSLARYNWRMDGQSAATDYAYDGEFFDRSGSDDFLSRQFMVNHGGFKTPTAVGQSSKWLTAFNLKLRRSKLPIGVFTDVGYSQSGDLLWDAGIYAVIIPEYMEVYLPLMYEKSIQTSVQANGLKWHDLIRFQIALEKVNLVESIKRFNFI